MKVLAVIALLGLSMTLVAQEAPQVEVLPVRGNVYMLASTLGNVTMQSGKDPGHDGVMLVDTGATSLADRILTAIRKVAADPVRFIVNTSADADHIGGNVALARYDSRPFFATPEVGVFAHDNVLARMNETKAPAGAWPTLTYTDGKMFEFNGEAIQIFGEKSAHSDGDSIVFFRGSNVISAGDVFTTTGYPVIDLKRGGSIQGEINALNHIISLSVPHAMQEGGTMIIPGHGRLCDQSDVVDYRDMMSIIRDRVADLIEKGKTLDEAKAARPTRDYDRRYSTPSWTGDMLTEAVYRSLKAK